MFFRLTGRPGRIVLSNVLTIPVAIIILVIVASPA